MAWSQPIHSDLDISEWCFPYAPRVEDSSAVLPCGPREEKAWWDNRTDAAVNDLEAVALTQDNDNLYVAIKLWTDPDPVLLPFFEIAIDHWGYQGLARYASPAARPDHLLVFDLSYWLVGAGDPVLLMQPGKVIDSDPWDPVLGCPPDFNGDTTVCDFPVVVNPGVGDQDVRAAGR